MNLRPPVLLVVEDDVDTLASLEELFRHALPAVQMLTAASVIEARRNAEGQVIDAMLVDYRLPDGTGLDLVDQLAARHRDVPVILLSAYGDESIVAGARARRQVVAFVRKPFSGAELVSSVGRELERRQGSAGRIPPGW